MPSCTRIFRLHGGLEAIAACNEGSKSAHRVSMNRVVFETVPVHGRWHKDRVVVLLCVTVLGVN